MGKAKMIRPGDLAGRVELAQRLGVGNNTISQWTMRYDDFPKPVAVLERGQIWCWSEVRAWAKKNGRPDAAAVKNGGRRA